MAKSNNILSRQYCNTHATLLSIQSPEIIKQLHSYQKTLVMLILNVDRTLLCSIVIFYSK